MCTFSLCRQIIHDESQVGLEKAVSAVNRMSRINSSISCNSLICKLTPENAMDIIQKYDLVVDATDNIDARYTINDCCVLLRKPFVSGSAVQMDGQITTVIPYVTPCYRCLYPSLSVTLGSCRSCADAGVLGPIPGLIGCLEAIEVIKLLLNRDRYVDNNSTIVQPQTTNTSTNSTTNTSTSADNTGRTEPTPKKQRVNGKSAAQLKPLLGRQVMFDAVTGEFHTFQLPLRSLHCAVCGDHPTVTNMTESRATLESSSSSVCPPVHVQPKNGVVAEGAVPDCQGTDLVDSTQAMTATAAPSTAPPVVTLKAENRITCRAFAKALHIASAASEQPVLSSSTLLEASPTPEHTNSCNKISLIVDVRSAEQFSITHLHHPHVLSFASLEETAVLETCSPTQRAEMLRQVHAVQVNVPLSVLKGGRAASQREANQRHVLNSLLRLRALLANHNVDSDDVKLQILASAEGSGARELATAAVTAVAKEESDMYVLCRRGIDSVTATQLLLALGVVPAVCNVEGGLTAWSKEVDTAFVMY